jgi:hypothetical protein
MHQRCRWHLELLLNLLSCQRMRCTACVNVCVHGKARLRAVLPAEQAPLARESVCPLVLLGLEFDC